MIRHILKKDCKLLWPLVAGVASLQLVLIVLDYIYGREGNAANSVVSMKGLLYLGWLFVAVIVVRQDPIPGVRQDWLVRPIRRRDLLLAKLSFALLMIHVPIFLVNVVDGLTYAMPLRQALTVAAGKCVLAAAVTLPCLAVASIFGTLQGAIAGSLSLLAGVAVLTFSILNPSMRWLATTAVNGLMLPAAIAAVLLTYLQRKTKTAGLLLAGIVICAGIGERFVTWPTWFALQQHFSPDPGASRKVVVTPPSGLRIDRVSNPVPLLAAGLPPDARILADASRVHSSAGATYDYGQLGWLVPPSTSTWNEQLYQRMPPEPGPVKIDLYLTLMQTSAQYSIEVDAPSRAFAGLGKCQAVVAGPGLVDLTCVNAMRPPCYTAVLEDVPTGEQGSPSSSCRPDYQPLRSWTTFPESVVRLAALSGEKLRQARVVLKLYEPQDHFTRHLEVARPGGL